MPTRNWKLEISDLRLLAQAVPTSPPSERLLSANGAALCFLGVLRRLAEAYGIDAMQYACATIVRHGPAWRTMMRHLPIPADRLGPPGSFDPGLTVTSIAMIAMVARGVMEVAGADNTRAALAYWASERDPSAIMDRVTDIRSSQPSGYATVSPVT